MKDKRDMNQQEQGVVIREKQRLGVDVKSASSAATAEMNADERDEDINQGNPFFDLPDEMMMSILSHVPPPDLLNARLMAKSKMGVVDATLEMLTKPHFIINYLSRADGITGHQFTAFYQRTQRYQELKRKVLAKEPLSAEEAICYTLTRDCKVLPIHLKKAMDAVELDENTREHLKLIMTLSEEIRAIQDQLKGVIHAKGVNYYKTKLLDHLNRHHRQHPHQFVNLFGADLSGLQLTDIDFSYLNLSGVQFSNADLRGANFRGAYLGGVDFSGALLSEADFTAAELKGVQLNRANLEEVDLSAINLEGIDFEWAFIRNVKLLPQDALNSPKELRAFLTQFEKSIANYSLISKRKLEEHLLKEIADSIEIDAERTRNEKIELLDVALAMIEQEDRIVGLFPFENACDELKKQWTSLQPKEDIPEHPLKKEAQGIIERILSILNGINRDTGKKIPDDPLDPMGIKIMHQREYKRLKKCIAKYPQLNDGIKLARALGISLELWYMLYFTSPGSSNRPSQFPTLLDAAFQGANEPKEKHYASEVFNGYQFDIQQLPKIEWADLEYYLYEEEDFVILNFDRYAKFCVKLGDLLITFWQEGHFLAMIEVIDFENRARKPAFSVDLKRYGNIPFDAFVPLDIYSRYPLDGVTIWHPNRDDIQCIQEAYALKKQIIERVFASEKINRTRKHNLSFPMDVLHEAQETKLELKLPPSEKENENESEWGFQKKQQRKSTKLAAPKAPGLFSATQQNLAHKNTSPLESSGINRSISN